MNVGMSATEESVNHRTIDDFILTSLSDDTESNKKAALLIATIPRP